jgi:hypothetical protein
MRRSDKRIRKEWAKCRAISSKSKGTRALRARIDPLSAAEGLMGGQRPRGEGYGAQSEAAHRPKRGVWEGGTPQDWLLFIRTTGGHLWLDGGSKNTGR